MDRPDGVPGGASWIAEWSEWGDGAADASGRQGPWRFWRADGTLCERSDWVDGALHGEKVRFHDDGSTAAVGAWERGVERRRTVWRTANPTREENLQGMAEAIRRAAFTYPEAGWVDSQRFFDADDREIVFDGTPVPERPAAIDPTAWYHPDGWWIAGQWANGSAENRGPRWFWDPAGTLVRVEYHRGGKNLAVADVREITYRGSVAIEAARVGDRDGFERLMARGFGAAPGLVEHAAYEQLHAWIPRIRASATVSPALPELRRPPVRDAAVDPAAVWVPGMSAYVLGTLDGDVPVGTWVRWWCPYDETMGADRPVPGDDAPLPVSFCARYEREFVDGVLRADKEFRSRGPRLKRVRRYDADGRQVRVDDFDDDGDLSKVTEFAADGAEIVRTFHSSGTLRSERVEREDQLVEERWFDESGAACGVVTPTDDPDRTHVSLLDPAGAVVAAGEARRNTLVGRWRLDGAELDVTSAQIRRAPHALEDLRAAAAWPAHVPELDGVDEVAWDAHETFFGDATRFPYLLRGLAGPPRAFDLAIGQLWDPILHQSTVSDAAGPAVRFAVAAIPRVDTSRRRKLLEWFARIATRDGQLAAARWLKQVWASRPDDPERRAAHYDERDTELAYDEILAALSDAYPRWIEAAADPDVQTRQCATLLLGMASHPDATAALVARCADPERLIRVEATLALVLHPADAVRDALAGAEVDPEPAVRLAAALTLLRLGEPTETAFDSVLAAVGGADVPGYGAAFLAHDALTDAASALSALPPERVESLVPRLGRSIEEVDAVAAVRVSRALLDLAFPRVAWDGESPLTPTQRQAVLAIAESHNAWRLNVDLFGVLRNNGLPTDKASLRRLARGEPDDGPHVG